MSATSIFKRWLSDALRLPRCDRLMYLISQALDRKLSSRERLLLRLHFIGCPQCVRYQEQLQMMQKLLAHPDRPSAIRAGNVSLRPDTRERLKRMLAAQANETGLK